MGGAYAKRIRKQGSAGNTRSRKACRVERLLEYVGAHFRSFDLQERTSRSVSILAAISVMSQHRQPTSLHCNMPAFQQTWSRGSHPGFHGRNKRMRHLRDAARTNI